MFYVSEIMTPSPHTLRAEAAISDAINIMAEKKIRHIPIINETDELVGIVSQRDLLVATGNKLESKTGKMATHKPVSEIMTTRVLTTKENAELIAAAKSLEQHKFGALPVVKDKKVVDIITDSDFLAVAINLLEQIAVTEPEELG